MHRHKAQLTFATVSLVVVSVLVLFNRPAFSAIDYSFDFEGKVTNSDGSSVSDGVYDMDFSLFSVPSGGSSIWSESLTAANRFSATISSVTPTASGITYSYSGALGTSTLRVGQYLSKGSSTGVLIVDFNTALGTISVATGSAEWSAAEAINNRPRVEGGVIDEKLGTVSGLSAVDFNQPLYLEVSFNGETMQPRKLLSATAQSFNSDKLDGRDASEFAALADNETVTGEWSFDNIVDISSSSSNTLLTITQNGSGDIVEVYRGGTRSFAVLSDGRVAIGSYILPTATGTPGYVLKSDGAGNVTWQVDLAGFGGSGLWATSSDSLLIRPVNTAQSVVIGNTATSAKGYIFEVDGSTLLDTVAISNGQELRLYESGNGNYVALRSSSTLGSDLVFSLPTSYGSAGDALLVDASGNMYWGTGVSGNQSGTAGQLPYYASSGDFISATSSIFLTPEGRFAIGTTSAEEVLQVAGNIKLTGDILPYNTISSVIGASSNRFANGYFDSLDVTNLTIGSSSLSGTNSNTLTINANNTTADLEDSYLEFERGTETPNASIRWDSTNDRFEFNYPIYLPTNILTSGYFGIGTTTPSQMLSVGGTSSQQFLVNENGTVVGGTWQGDIIGVQYGGTGTSTFEADSLLYASTDNVIGEILSGTPGYILQIDSGGTPVWAATSSLGIDINATGGTLTVDKGGTGQDFSGSTGFVYVDSGVMSASSTIAITSTDLAAASGIVLSGNTITLDNTGNWIGTFDGLEGTDVFQISDWYATTTDGLAEGTVNKYYATQLFAADLSATTSLPNIAALSGLQEVGVINIGTWNGDILDLAYGGTGTSTFESNSLVYASAKNTIGEIIATTPGYILQLNGSNVPTWVSTTTLGMDFSAIGGVLGVDKGGTGQDFSGATGFVYMDSGVASASSTISIVNTDLSAGTGLNLISNAITLDNTGNWAGTWQSNSPSDFLSLSAWYATTTDGLQEGSLNQYYTNARARASISATGPLDYNSGTGVITLLSGYNIPLTASTSNWNSAYNSVNANSANWDSAYSWGDHAGLYDPKGQATSSVNLHESTYNHANYNTTFNIVNASSTLWDTAYLWGDHSTAGYFSTTSDILDPAYGGIGADSSGWDGVIVANNGTWGASTTLGLNRGGLGINSITSQSLVYASSDNALAELAVGAEGEVLAVVGGNLTWASTAAPAAHSVLSVSHSDVDATSTLMRGDLMIAQDYGSTKWGRMQLGALGYILYSDGTDAVWASSSVITELGTITQGIWQASPVDVAFGGTGATTASSAQTNLGLDKVAKFGINATGTDGYVWQSDGVGRGRWVATTSLGIGGSSGGSADYSLFVGTTTVQTDGAFATSTLSGYAAANNMCASEYAGSHFCRTYDILVTFERNGTYGEDGRAWVAEGPPGFTSSSNDCDGWTTNSATALGAWWNFNSSGGQGYLIYCDQLRPLACCTRQ